MSVADRASIVSMANVARKWTLVSILCLIFYIVAVVISHLLRPDLSPTMNFLSEYVVGLYGFVMTSALLAHGFGSLALSAGLWPSVATAASSRIGLLLLAIGGTGLVLAGIFPLEFQNNASGYQTWSGMIHDLGAFIFFTGTVAGALLTSFDFRRNKLWQKQARSEAILALLALAAYLVFFTIYLMQTGEDQSTSLFTRSIVLFQRALVLSIWLWQLVTALRLRRLYAAA